MLDMVTGSVFDLLAMNANCAMAVHAPNVFRVCSHGFGNSDLFPPPFVAVFNFVFLALLAPEHQIVWHEILTYAASQRALEKCLLE